eukprot:SAG31_NODE_38946_length_292_cov_0.787565_1_plen_34_part_10
MSGYETPPYRSTKFKFTAVVRAPVHFLFVYSRDL